MMLQANIQGINDAYLVIVGIGAVALLLSFFIKRVKQAPDIEEKPKSTLKRAISKEA